MKHGGYSTLVPRRPEPYKHNEAIEPDELKKAIIQCDTGDAIKLFPAVYDAKNDFFYRPVSSPNGSVNVVKMAGTNFEELFAYPEEYKDWLWCYKVPNPKRVEEYAVYMMHTERNVPPAVVELLSAIKAEFKERFATSVAMFTAE